MPAPSSTNSLKSQMDSELRKVLPAFLSSDENADLISSQIDKILQESMPSMVAAPAVSGGIPNQKEIIEQFGNPPERSAEESTKEDQSGAYEAAEPNEYEQEKDEETNAVSEEQPDEQQQQESEAEQPEGESEPTEGNEAGQQEKPAPSTPPTPEKTSPPEENEQDAQPKTEGDPLGFKTAPTEHPMYDESGAAAAPQKKEGGEQSEQEREKKQAEALQQERNQARTQQTQAVQGQQAASIASQKKQILLNASRLGIKGMVALKATYITTDFIDVLEFEDGATLSAIFNIVTVATSGTVFVMQNGETKKFIINKYMLKACGAAIAESIPIINIIPWDTINGFMLARAVKKRKSEYNEEIQRLEASTKGNNGKTNTIEQKK